MTHWGLPLDLVLLLLGAVMTAVTATTVWLGFCSRGWTKTAGTIDKVRIDDNPGTLRSGATYAVVVEYHFEVDGQIYRSDRTDYDLGDRYEESFDAVQASKEYLVGGKIDIYFDPADPRRSVRRIGIGARSLRLLVIGLIFLALGAYLPSGR